MPGEAREDRAGVFVPVGGPVERDSRAHAFAQGGVLDTAAPCPALAMVLDEVSGAEARCTGMTDDEVIGALGRWDAEESWCAARRLGVVRELIRRRAAPGRGPATPGGLPSAWAMSLIEEIALELGISKNAADAMIDLAWTLEARLPQTAASLEAGILNLGKVRIIAENTGWMDDAGARAAEDLVIGKLAGKTPGQVGQLIARAALAVDPDGARKRREKAEQDEARVRLWREYSGTAAVGAYGLPVAEGLAADQNIQARALELKAAGHPGTMDQLRVRAWLDLINRTDSRPSAGDDATASASHGDPGGAGDQAPGTEGSSSAAGTDGTGGARDADHPGDPAGTDSAGGAGDAGDRQDGRDDAIGDSSIGAGLAARINLTIPLATLLGLDERPGEAPGLGAIDPALARQLAAAAARDHRSAWCVTVTDQEGHAIGHGCARIRRTARAKRGRSGGGGTGSRDGPAFRRDNDHDPRGGYGTWRLTLEGGRELTVKLVPIPVTDCDHRYESGGHDPGVMLRHLVEIRDGGCTLPPCARAARRCDFEHAVPFEKGGRTCGCNGGCRCRRDHKIKQSQGWDVSQPLPGWHRWTTPSGRHYTAPPMEYSR